MLFHPDIEKLRQRPIPIDPWMNDQVGDVNDGPYKVLYPLMAVAEKTVGELVDISTYGIVSSDFYLDQLMLGDGYLTPGLEGQLFWPRALLRESHAKRLAEVDAYLRGRGLFLFVVSGWRHPDVQKLVHDNYAAKHGEVAASRMFAPMQPGSSPPPHATGAAVDIEIWSLESRKRLEMYCAINGEQIYSAYKLERMIAESPDLLKDELVCDSVMNRRILFHVLCSQGVVFNEKKALFCNHPGEFWHFGDGDPLSAYLSRQQAAQYGLALPSKR